MSLRVSRSFRLTNGSRIEGLIEAFNLTNRVNPITRNTTFGPGSYPSSPVSSFNTVTAVGDPMNRAVRPPILVLKQGEEMVVKTGFTSFRMASLITLACVVAAGAAKITGTTTRSAWPAAPMRTPRSRQAVRSWESCGQPVRRMASRTSLCRNEPRRRALVSGARACESGRW